jgi:hypothetical protein
MTPICRWVIDSGPCTLGHPAIPSEIEVGHAR